MVVTARHGEPAYKKCHTLHTLVLFPEKPREIRLRAEFVRFPSLHNITTPLFTDIIHKYLHSKINAPQHIIIIGYHLSRPPNVAV